MQWKSEEIKILQYYHFNVALLIQQRGIIYQSLGDTYNDQYSFYE